MLSNSHRQTRSSTATAVEATQKIANPNRLDERDALSTLSAEGVV
jgi:hypothetical protein